MAAPVSCERCKAKITDSKLALRCMLCKKYYDFDCAGYSEKLHRLMDASSKQKWKCKICLSTASTSKSAEKGSTNVTLRKKTIIKEQTKILPKTDQKHIKTNNTKDISIEEPTVELPSTVLPTSKATDSNFLLNPTQTMDSDSFILSENDMSDSESCSKSMFMSRSADFTLSETTTTREMKENIAQLTLDLATTQNELENCIMENNKLQKEINRMSNEIEVLKKLCKSSLSDKKAKNKRCEKIKKRHSMCVSSLPVLSSSTPIRPSVNNSYFNLPNIQNVSSLEEMITKQQQELNKAQEEITYLNKQIEYLKELTCVTQTECPPCAYTLATHQVSDADNNQLSQPTASVKRKHKVLLFADENGRGLRDKLERLLGSDYSVIAELKPYASLDQVVTIHNTLLCNNLTKSDYVIILAGSHDNNF